MSNRLRPIGEPQRRRILKRDNYTCVYCFELATECDHIIPYSYIPDNTDANLVASCRLCNAIAGSMVFDSFILKYQYIKREREKRTRPHNPQWYMSAVRAMMDAETEAPEPVKVVKPPKPKYVKPPKVKPIVEQVAKPKPKPQPKKRDYSIEKFFRDWRKKPISAELRAILDAKHEAQMARMAIYAPEQKAVFDYWYYRNRRPVIGDDDS